jgi:hypothetical protein
MNTKLEKQFSDAVRKARKENEHKLPIMMHYAMMEIVREAYEAGVLEGMQWGSKHE